MARFPGSGPVYEVADLFRQRCLVENKSLLWPDEEAWTPDNLDNFWVAFVEHPDTSGDPFDIKLGRQLADAPDSVHRIAVDLAILYCLFPTSGSGGMGLVSKKNLIEEIKQLRLDSSAPDGPTWGQCMEAFEHPIGAPGMFYLTGRPFQFAFFLEFARKLKSQSADAFNAKQCKLLADVAKQQVKDQFGQMPGLGRNILLHMLFPENFERIAADSSKLQILKAFANDVTIGTDTEIDDGLLLIREHLKASRDWETFDFYDAGIKDLWDVQKDSTPPIPKPTSVVNEVPLGEIKTDLTADTLRTLVATIYLDEDFVQEMNDLLIEKQQLIFEGPPGSGKTYVAEKFARWFTGQSLDAKTPLNEQVEIAQFHQSYGYEDFVQGIRPETNENGQLVYKVRDGIFLTLCKRAKANPEKPFLLIIDEINRGNISRIFGELLLLLEYRGMSVRLPNGSGDPATLTIPENLYIIGTMNTADRSLAQIDYALRRRFYFVRFMPVQNGRAEVYENWLLEQDDITATDRSRLLTMFIDLNVGISEKLNSADLQVGHSYFMQDNIETEAGLNRVWTRAVAPLLNEYLHHHRDRDDILAALTPASLSPNSISAAQEDELPVDESWGQDGQPADHAQDM